MNAIDDSTHAASMPRFTRVASVLAGATSSLVLMGWWLDIAALKSVLPGFATMKPNTAVAFVFSSAALWLKLSAASGSRYARLLATTCAFVTFMIGLLTVIEYLTGSNLGLDQILFSDAANAGATYPGRMAIATACGFLLLGTALLLFDLKTARGHHLSQGLAIFTGATALIALIAYAYDVQTLYRIDAFSSVALHTAILFLLLSVGVLCARTDRTPMTLFSRFRFGLVPQIVTVVVLVVVLVGGLISAVMLRQSQNTLREQIITNNLASVDLAAELAHRYIEGTQIAVRLFARSPFIEQSVFSGDFSRATPELQEFLRLNPRVNGCSLIDGKGIYRATGTTPALSPGNSARDREWYQQVIATGKDYLGLPTITRSTARPVVPYVMPILNSKGEVKGMLLCGISLAALNDAFAKFQTSPSARASLTDRRGGGVILAHVDRGRVLKSVTGRNKAVDRMLKGERGAVETTNSAGELNLAVYAPVPDLPWGTMILQPSEAAFAPIYKALRQSILFTALCLVFSAVVSGLLARRVTHPLVRLRTAAGRLAAGDIATRLNFTRQDEVGDLGRAFDQMATALADHSAQLRAANEDLQAQYLQIQDANRLKSEFLANMSHELRTPLNAIIGFAQLMHDGKVGAVNANQEEYLNDILTSADHLLQLINDVLDLAKVESGKLEFEPEPVHLTKLIAELRNILQPLTAAKRLTIGAEVDDAVEQVILDPAKLKQVLYNYLSNAIKFTPQEGRISVRARMEDQAHFRLEVEDSGIGITPDEIEKLFIAFKQLDSSTTKKHQGTGLGLVLTKKIVEAQGGRVGVQSHRGHGSIFHAILPLAADMKKPSAPAPALAAPAPDAPTILVIEDSEADLKWLIQTLTQAGYRVETAKTGAEAIVKSQARTYAAILLDLILPDTGGWEILHAIRTAGPNQNTPVVVVTVVAEKGVAKGFPVQDYLVKPIHPKALLDALKSAGAYPRDVTKRVMVVDDDAKTLKLAQVGLQASGYEVVCHNSGASALHDAAHSEFAAVVLDLVMPQMDGFEFLDRFRQIDKCRNTPVIVWTNKDITSADFERLKISAQSIALKNRDGIATVLKALQHQALAGGTAALAHESASAHQRANP
jgi:signal transduction histidine kinase/DNA-binding response OmpR family regulator